MICKLTIFEENVEEQTSRDLYVFANGVKEWNRRTYRCECEGNNKQKEGE